MRKEPQGPLRVVSRLFKDKRAFYYYAQKSIRNSHLREACSSVVTSFLPHSKSNGKGEVPAGVNELVAQLKSDGYCFTKHLVTPLKIKEILDFLRDQDVTDTLRPELGRFKAPNGMPDYVRKAEYDQKTVLACPHFLEIGNDPVVLAAVERILGCKPTISNMTCWWSLSGNGEKSKKELEQVYGDDHFHRDVEDFRFIKLFVYLTDVSEDSGPHVFVVGSHNSGALTRRGSIPDEDVLRTFGADKVKTYTGPAGTAFLENTWGVHRATPARTGNRLIFQVTYALTGLNPQTWSGASKREHQWDRYVNRIYLPVN